MGAAPADASIPCQVGISLMRNVTPAVGFLAAVMLFSAGCSRHEPPQPAPESYDVVITGFGENKIQAIKAVREVTGLGLKDAKGLVDNAPSVAKKGLSKPDADALAEKLRQSGLVVEVRPR